MNSTYDKNKINLASIRAHDMEQQLPSFMPPQSRKRKATPRTISGSPKKAKMTKYTASTKNNFHLSKNFKKGLTTVIAAATLALGGGAIGYNFATENTGNVEYSLDTYNPSDMFTATDNLIKNVAKSTYFSMHPDETKRFEGFNLQSYTERVVSSNGDVSLMLNFTKPDSSLQGGVDSRSVPVSLPKDFGKDVYLNYKELREKSQSFTEDEKGTVSYMIAMNSCVNKLRDGLNNYINNTKNNNYKEAAQGALNSSKVNMDRTDDEER